MQPCQLHKVVLLLKFTPSLQRIRYWATLRVAVQRIAQRGVSVIV
jgi:hypothetical protein